MRQQYDAALKHFAKVAEMFPDSPEGVLFQAAAIQARSMDFRDFGENKQFDSLLAISEKLSEEMIERNPQSPWGHYYLGTTRGMISYDLIQRGDYLGGYFKGRSSVSEIEETLELDSTFYDCYSILGTYYYWKSRKTTWIPFFTDEREKGIQCLLLASERGRYQKYPALSNLVWVYLDAQRWAETEPYARRALHLYPRQRAFLHALASSLMGQRRFEEAKVAYENQLAEILTVNAPNAYNEIGARLNIVFMKKELRDTTNVREHLDRIFSKAKGRFPRNLQDKLEQHLEHARRLHAEISSGTFPGQ